MLSRILLPFCLASTLVMSQSALAATKDSPRHRLPTYDFSAKPSPQSKPMLPAGLSPSVMPAKGSDRLLNGIKARALGVPVWHSDRNEAPSVMAPYVIGGQDVPEGERSFQVSLQSPFFDHFCGGALIDRQWVLTASHCVNPFLTSTGFSVFLGSNRLAPDATRIDVDWVYVHPNYNFVPMDADIALLHLAQPAPEHIPTLALADEAVMASVGQAGATATVSGWGITSEGIGTDVLQQVNVPIYDAAQCEQSYLDAMGRMITSNMLCAGFADGNAGSCYGDSGGPLTVTADGVDYSVGVVSWGSPNCTDPDLPGVYARTASFKDWIDEAIAFDPPSVQTIAIQEPVSLDLTAGQSVYYALELPEAARDARVALVGGGSDAVFAVYRGRIPSAEGLLCESSQDVDGQGCHFGLSTAGVYSIVVHAVNDVQGLVLFTDYTPIELTNHSVVDGISLHSGHWARLPLRIEQTAYDVVISLSGDNGDADLFVYPAIPSEQPSAQPVECQSTNGGSYEECYFEVLEPGDYWVEIAAYERFQDLTLTVDWSEQLSFFPQAICEHSVVSQFGQYFFAAITVVNVSGDYLNDWYVEWDYQNDAQVQLIYNGILTAYEPYRAESPERGRAIAPGGMTTLYMLVKSPQQVAENPIVSGNFCF